MEHAQEIKTFGAFAGLRAGINVWQFTLKKVLEMLHCVSYQLQCDGETHNGSMISTVTSLKKRDRAFFVWSLHTCLVSVRVSLTVCVWLSLLSALSPDTAVGS